MREIKFRFFRELPSKKMIYDNPDIYIGFEGSVYGIVRYSEKDIEHSKLNLVPLQYTGLKDKNGTEIYEGDIVDTHPFHKISHPKNRYQKVIFWAGSFEAEHNNFGWEGEEIVVLEECKVIGNIYENTELINQINN